jgi:hypothetical protein
VYFHLVWWHPYHLKETGLRACLWFLLYTNEKKALGEVFDKTLSVISGKTIGSNAAAQRIDLNIHKSSSTHNRQRKQSYIIVDIVTPTLSQSSTAQQSCAILVEASSTTYDNECLRLVNIVFQESQTFQSIIGTCGNMNQYLQKELLKKYSDEYFRSIIDQNNAAFGSAIDDGDYFAEIEHERYRVLIFTTGSNGKVNLEIHDAKNDRKIKITFLFYKDHKTL